MAKKFKSLVDDLSDNAKEGVANKIDILLAEILPCDIKLPPKTTIKAGCTVGTLLTAIKQREGMNCKFGEDKLEHNINGEDCWCEPDIEIAGDSKIITHKERH
jgi:hypothetical protein